jgi:NAD(P)H-dependent FMN reductase
MKYKITAISGSLRKNSYNTSLLNSLKVIAERSEISIKVVTLNNIPFYSEDLEEKGVPKYVAKLSETIKNSNAVIISTPEYNGMFSGALLNTLEWLSRDSVGKPLREKILAVIGSTTGGLGSEKAQTFLKLLGVNLNMIPMNSPKLRISHAHEKFDDKGRLVDEEVKNEIDEYLMGMQSFIEKFSLN